MGKPGPKLRSQAERFWPKVQKTDTCWIWQGGKMGYEGYGLFYWDSDSCGIAAHRAAWLLCRGEIPDGLNVLHRCDNPPCVNPDHLFLGTQTDNSADMISKHRWRRDWIPHGANSGMAKLTNDQVLEIRASQEDGVTLARAFGVTKTTISKIRLRRTWNHLP